MLKNSLCNTHIFSERHRKMWILSALLKAYIFINNRSRFKLYIFENIRFSVG